MEEVDISAIEEIWDELPETDITYLNADFAVAEVAAAIAKVSNSSAPDFRGMIFAPLKRAPIAVVEQITSERTGRGPRALRRGPMRRPSTGPAQPKWRHCGRGKAPASVSPTTEAQ